MPRIRVDNIQQLIGKHSEIIDPLSIIEDPRQIISYKALRTFLIPDLTGKFLQK